MNHKILHNKGTKQIKSLKHDTLNSEGIWKPVEVLVFGADANAVGIATEPSAFIVVW